jgi:hypothetical protein
MNLAEQTTRHQVGDVQWAGCGPQSTQLSQRDETTAFFRTEREPRHAERGEKRSNDGAGCGACVHVSTDALCRRTRRLSQGEPAPGAVRARAAEVSCTHRPASPRSQVQRIEPTDLLRCLLDIDWRHAGLVGSCRLTTATQHTPPTSPQHTSPQLVNTTDGTR